MSKQHHRPQQQTPQQQVEAATKVRDKLKAERQQIATKAAELQEACKRIAFAAHGMGDAEASRELTTVRGESLNAERLLAEHDHAIAEAEQRLQQAHQAEAKAADAAQARQLRKAVERFASIGRDLDRLFQQIGERGAALQEALGEIHNYGSPFPTRQQLNVLGMIALRSSLQSTPWERAVERTSPGERRSFGALCAGWRDTIEQSNIRPRLGESEAA
jgi:DNA repair ATPase RecN